MNVSKLTRIFRQRAVALGLSLSTVSSGSAYAGLHTLRVSGGQLQWDGHHIKIYGVRVAAAALNSAYTHSLIANLDDYKSYGINMMAVYIMGGSGGNEDPFNPDGTAFRDIGVQSRLQQIIEACDVRGMVVVLGIFYQKVGAPVLADWRASQQAVKTVAAWLKTQNYTNVILNIANEQNSGGYANMPWKRVRNSGDLLGLCALAKSIDPSLLAGGGGYGDSANIAIGRDSRCDVLLFDTGSSSKGMSGSNLSGVAQAIYVKGGVTNKPMINVEEFGGATQSFAPPGVYPASAISLYEREVDSIQGKELGDTFHSSLWYQGAGFGFSDRFDVGGQGLSGDPGGRWYFQYVATKLPPPPGTIAVDDSVIGSEPNRFNYLGSGWGHCTACDLTSGEYDNSDSWTGATNDSVTVAFAGTRISYFAVLGPNEGIAALSVDGGAETRVDLYRSAQLGDQLKWTSPTLANASHTLKIRETGAKSASSSSALITVDRVDIVTGASDR